MREKGGNEEERKIDLQHVLIKWTGGKRRQARRIVERFPRKIATYHEPFLSGGAVLYELLGRTDIRVGRIECGDLCAPLIDLWQVVRDDPDGLLRRYAEDWAASDLKGRTTTARSGTGSTAPATPTTSSFCCGPAATAWFASTGGPSSTPASMGQGQGWTPRRPAGPTAGPHRVCRESAPFAHLNTSIDTYLFPGPWRTHHGQHDWNT